ncbi:hypothetical protein EYC59_03925 [Candidatus Saccharibacteria bacterium]|nr:MAG: hypothetical protein EYC59_03925 [Candidatus Saccharibacteria bacterium]
MRFRNQIFHPLNRRGDTIVEVLIAVGVISFILISAYMISNRSTHSIRTGQERQEALALAQSQIELIRLSNGLNTTSKGCFNGTQIAADRGSDDCRFKVDGSSGCTDAETYCYAVDTTRDSEGTYEVKIVWDNLSASQNTISLWYRPPFGLISAAGGGGGAGSGASGAAAINPGGCGGPTQPACPGVPPPAGAYHYERSFLNISANDPAHVTGCTWDWGNGTSTIYGTGSTYCLYGTWTPEQLFPPSTPLPAYPAACPGVPGANAYRYQYTVTVTITFDNARPKTSNPSRGWMPDCF